MSDHSNDQNDAGQRTDASHPMRAKRKRNTYEGMNTFSLKKKQSTPSPRDTPPSSSVHQNYHNTQPQPTGNIWNNTNMMTHHRPPPAMSYTAQYMIPGSHQHQCGPTSHSLPTNLLSSTNSEFYVSNIPNSLSNLTYEVPYYGSVRTQVATAVQATETSPKQTTTRKTMKACTNCRKSKSKCENPGTIPCKKCETQGLQCIFEVKQSGNNVVYGNETQEMYSARSETFETQMESRIVELENNFANQFSSLFNYIKDRLPINGHEQSAGGGSKAIINGGRQVPTLLGSTNNTINNQTYPPDTRYTYRNGTQYSPSNCIYGQSSCANYDKEIAGSSALLSPAEELAISQLGYSYAGGHPDPPYPPSSIPSPSSYSSKADSVNLSSRPLSNTSDKSRVSNADIDSRAGDIARTDVESDLTVTYEQASELFSYFHEKISPHLYGFGSSNLSLSSVWYRSKILTVAICTIASINHSILHYLYPALKSDLENLTKAVLFSSAKSDEETVDTILALCVAGCWLPDSFMLTSIALRLASNIGLNIPGTIPPREEMGDVVNTIDGQEECNEPMSDRYRLKLWYLLCNLDGNQSLISTNEPIVSKDDRAVLRSRELLGAVPAMPDMGQLRGLIPKYFSVFDKTHSINEISSTSEDRLNVVDDLVSDTNNASEAAIAVIKKPLNRFKVKKNVSGKEQGIDISAALLSDMRLVSQLEFNQAVKSVLHNRGWKLLDPANTGVPWENNLDLDKWMVSWACLLTSSNTEASSWPSKSTLIHYNFAKMRINSVAIRNLSASGGKLSPNHYGSTDIISKSGTSGMGISNNTTKSDKIAISAAQSILKLATTDHDILDALRYIPIHIHMMLYYSALFLLHSASSMEDARSFKDNLDAISLARDLRLAMLNSARSDKHITYEIASCLKDAVQEKVNELQKRKDWDLIENKVIKAADSTGIDLTISRRPTTISAWPGNGPAHPGVT